mmetsp:Transcript_113841/g.361865  ORF Transcript_113841/g.361865 Transcript_113841/m.361865 type:complete len:82 (+) Transcript_113841:1415-1660(+)
MLAAVLAAVHLVGAARTRASSPERCGDALWQTCSFVYIAVPTTVMLLLFCGTPWLLCCVVAEQYIRSRSLDKYLTEIVEPL